MKQRFFFQYDTRPLAGWTGFCLDTYKRAYSRARSALGRLRVRVENGHLAVLQAPFFEPDHILTHQDRFEQGLSQHRRFHQNGRQHGQNNESFLDPAWKSQGLIDQGRDKEALWSQKASGPSCLVPEPVQKALDQAKLILILSDPSTTLGARALASLVQSWVWMESGRPRLCFLDRADPEAFWQMMALADPLTTMVVVCGPTADSQNTPLDALAHEATLLTLMRCLEYWKGAIDDRALAQRFLVLASTLDTPLGHLAKTFGLPVAFYPQGPDTSLPFFHGPLGAPLQAAGVNVSLFRRGAAVVCAQAFTGALRTPLEGAALMAMMHHQGRGRAAPLGIHTALQNPLADMRQPSPARCVFASMHMGASAVLPWLAHLSQHFGAHATYCDSLSRDLQTCPSQPGDGYAAANHPKDAGPLWAPYEQPLTMPYQDLWTLIHVRKQVPERLDPPFWDTVPSLQALATSYLSQIPGRRHDAALDGLIQRGHGVRCVQLQTLTEEPLGALFMNQILESLLFREMLYPTPSSALGN
jgi:hypothetical protein